MKVLKYINISIGLLKNVKYSKKYQTQRKLLALILFCNFFMFNREGQLQLQYIVNNKSMLIFQKQAVIQEPPKSWEASLKESLIKKCHAFIAAHPQKQTIIEKPKLWYNFVSHDGFQEQHNYELVEGGHGLYSEYVPVKSNQYLSNEFSQYFHYIKHLAEKHSAEYQIKLFQISNTIENSKGHQQWMKICKKYLIDLTIQEMFYYYHLLLLKGVGFIIKIMKERDVKCSKDAFLLKILEIRRFSHQGSHINSHLAVSIDKGQQITLENLSKTLKYLYCSICMIYDCQRHFLPTCAINNNFQYIREYDIRHRLENRKRSANNLFRRLLMMANLTQTNAQEFCSEKCYKKLTTEKWKQLKLQRQKRIFSPVFKGFVKMGIQLFNYNPCSIYNLFINTSTIKNAKKNEEATFCEQIFFYFVEEFNLPQKLQFKFYETEIDQLRNESKAVSIFTTSVTPKKPMKKLDKSIKKTQNNDEYNSICFHYFLDKEPNDITCLSCDCQIRGYCLPSCGCSEMCEIRRIGCRCKRESNCWENKCPCFKSNLVCLPEICDHCFSKEENAERKNWCQNNEIFIHKSKLTRIGKSKIQNAGLGLFAGEYIFKGEFVMKYLGETIDSVSLEKIRESLVQNNLFYTFKLNKYQSVDSRIYGNKARFINHSKKSANLVPKSMRINEEYVIVFHATRDIQKDEELYFNYNGEGELSEFKEKFPFID